MCVENVVDQVKVVRCYVVWCVQLQDDGGYCIIVEQFIEEVVYRGVVYWIWVVGVGYWLVDYCIGQVDYIDQFLGDVYWLFVGVGYFEVVGFQYVVVVGDFFFQIVVYQCFVDGWLYQ